MVLAYCRVNYDYNDNKCVPHKYKEESRCFSDQKSLLCFGGSYASLDSSQDLIFSRFYNIFFIVFSSVLEGCSSADTPKHFN
jgi:hypothetical protein